VSSAATAARATAIRMFLARYAIAVSLSWVRG
jgi:hypothetical protein